MLKMGLFKQLKYFGYFKNHLYAYYRYPIHIFLNVLGKKQVKAAEIFLETRCNFDCWHCSASGWVNRKGKNGLSLDEVEAILRNLKSAGVISVCFVGGEPTIREDLAKIIRITRGHKILPTIITNAFLLNEQIIDSLFKNGLANMGFSLHSMDSKSNDKLVNHPGAFERAMHSLEYCLKRRYVCSICAVPTNENLSNGDFDRLVGFANKNGIRINVNLPAPIGKLTSIEEEILNKDAVGRLVERYFGLENFLPDFKINNLKSSIYCPMAKDTIYIFPNGETCPCTFVHISFGNALKEPISAILRRMKESPLLGNVEKRGQCPISMDRDFIRKVDSIIKKSSEIPVKYY